MGQTMLGAVFKGEGKLVLEERPIPQIKDAHDVLLAVRGVGICGSDLHVLDVPPKHPATPDVIMGHEFCGEVAEVGAAVTNCSPGDRVAIDQNAACGHCQECRRGSPNSCLTVFNSAPIPGYSNTPGIFHDGALARYIVIPDYMVYQVGPSVPWHHMAATEILACAVNAVKKAKPESGETAVVLGAGPVGQLLASLFKLAGAKVIASEVAEYRRKVAARLGADVVVDPSSESLADVVRRETDGKGADIVMEAVGDLLNDCIEVARFGGRVVLFGHDSLALPQVPQAQIVQKEVQIFGAFLARYTFVPAIRLLEQGLLPMDDVVTHILPLNEIFEAHRMLRAGEALKIVIDPTK